MPFSRKQYSWTFFDTLFLVSRFKGITEIKGKGNELSFNPHVVHEVLMSLVISWLHFYIIMLKLWFPWSIVKYATFIHPLLVWYGLRVTENFLKNVSNCKTTFFSKKQPRSGIFTKISVTHNRNWYPSLHFL